VVEEKAEEEKEMMRAIELYEIAFIELVMPINVSNSSDKLAFGKAKSCKMKDF
jgi:hypothetical protein